MPIKGSSIQTPVSSANEPSSRAPEMMRVPEGDFLMGTSDRQVLQLLQKEDWAKEWQEKNLFQMEQPQHTVTVTAFSIGLHPVTNAQYQIFVWESGHKVPKGWEGLRFPEDRGDYPVVNISLEDALAYCIWLSKEVGREFRLPTEAEWEKAARGGDARIYPWGDEFDPWRCNTLESSKNGTTPVKNYSPAGDSPYGCTDMSGNVFEWTLNSLTAYPFSNIRVAAKPDPSMKYTVRGGAWYYSRKLARCSAREGVLSTYTSPALGFRVVSVY